MVFETVVDVMKARARDGRDAHLRFLPASADPEELALDDLVELASRQATTFRRIGLRSGDRVVFMLRSNFDFVRMLLGAFAGGVIPVPLYPPTSIKRISHYLQNLDGILRTVEPRAVIALSEVRSVLELVRDGMPKDTAVHVLSELPAAETGLELAAVSADDPALIQFSSGSTGMPKGAVVSHGNLLANLTAIQHRAFDAPGDTLCSWLPMYHDMGILALLRPLTFRYHFVLMEPDAFLRRPSRWLQAISQHRGTITGCPNFAFELMCRRVPEAELEGVDLSSWRMACNGAEPIRTDVVEAFIQKYEPHGFRRDAMYPCYGLSEFTLAASLPEVGRVVLARTFRRAELEEDGVAVPLDEAASGDAASSDAASSGAASGGAASGGAICISGLGSAPLGHELRILDQDGRSLPDGRVGEVVVTGPSLTRGYFNAAERTARAFGAWVAGDDRRWLRTGDSGFVLDGQLYVLGRLDDMIIIRGRKFHPTDLEDLASAVPGVRSGCCAAFQLRSNDGRSRLVLIAETRDRKRAEIMEHEISVRVNAALGVQLDEIVFIAPGTLPKTSSGKIARNAARKALVDGQLRHRPAVDWVRATALKLRLLWSHARSSVRTRLRRDARSSR